MTKKQEARKRANARYYAKHKESKLAYNREYQKDHREEITKRVKVFYSERPLYSTWCGMKERCLNPEHTSYKYYGGREIIICQAWLDSFEQFEKDMGPKPTLEHTLDRIDNDGNYEPSNCKWSTPAEQNLNRRSVK